MERKRERYCYRVRPSVAALCLSVLLFASGAPAQTVAFINPGKSDEIYWITATQSMQAAAKSLGMAFEVQYAQREPLKTLEIAREVLQFRFLAAVGATILSAQHFRRALIA